MIKRVLAFDTESMSGDPCEFIFDSEKGIAKQIMDDSIEDGEPVTFEEAVAWWIENPAPEDENFIFLTDEQMEDAYTLLKSILGK
jgi:hypothetical protein